MGFFSSGLRTTLIGWTPDCRLDRAALIASSTWSRFDLVRQNSYATLLLRYFSFSSLFSDPNKASRVLYAEYWQKKLKDNKDVSFPDSLVIVVAEETEGFSFAYLKEALYACSVYCMYARLLNPIPFSLAFLHW